MQRVVMRSIAVVDDDPEVVDLMITILREEGYNCRGFTDGREALAALSSDPPALVFVDVSMPDVDGIQLCQALKADPRTSGAKVVFLSGHSHLEREAASAGADGYLVKPFDLDEVIKRTANFMASAGCQIGAS